LLQSFINFIKEFEENISTCIKNKYPYLEISSILIKNTTNNILSLKININDKIKISSTHTPIQIKDFNINNEIEFVMKINFIWVKDNKFGINCNIYQIKYYASIQELNIDLLDTNNTTNLNITLSSTNMPSTITPNNNTIQTSQQLPIITKEVSKQPLDVLVITNQEQEIIPKKLNLIPSIDALLNAKKNLKSTTKL
jgi:hypothetical protein